jgi:hypothetical protein
MTRSGYAASRPEVDAAPASPSVPAPPADPSARRAGLTRAASEGASGGVETALAAAQAASSSRIVGDCSDAS